MMKIVSLFISLIVCTQLVAQEITGYWKHLSKNWENECLIYVYEYQGGYYARIIGTYDDKGVMNDDLYAPKERAMNVAGSPFYCGLDLLWNLRESGSRYKGKIIDPRNGKIYHAKVWVNGEGNLIVRGELLFFGKSVTWYPAEESDFPPGFKKPDVTKFVPVIPDS
jgi:uncharacterized protein (DUF2147 family)